LLCNPVYSTSGCDLKISAQHLTDLHARNERSNFSKNFDFDDIQVDPTFHNLNNHANQNCFFPSTTKNNALTYQKNNGSVCNNSETNSTIFNEKLMANRQEAEQMSALKSLKTNLVMILLVSLSILIILIPSKIWQTYFLIVNSSVLKVLLPIVTTMANFGTVQSLAILENNSENFIYLYCCL